PPPAEARLGAAYAVANAGVKPPAGLAPLSCDPERAPHESQGSDRPMPHDTERSKPGARRRNRQSAAILHGWISSWQGSIYSGHVGRCGCYGARPKFPGGQSMELYLVRHGIAEDGGEGVRDGSRALTEKGRRRFQKTARAFGKLGRKLDLILTS